VIWLALPLAAVAAVAGGGVAGGGVAAAQDLTHLSDEFDSPASLASYLRVHVVEEWNADQLELLDVDGSYPGHMTLIPYTTSWYQDYRGPLVHRRVGGDLVVTAEVTSTGRDGVSPPAALYSLGGIMIRAPRDVTPDTWVPGQEHYVFLSIGYGAGDPGFMFEVKRTMWSASELWLTGTDGPRARLQIARIGSVVLTLVRPEGGDWTVHRRFVHPELPDTVQVGLVAYTDWTKVEDFDEFVHNTTVLDPPLPDGVDDPTPGEPFAPDLAMRADYLRFVQPQVPAELEGRDLSDPGDVTDEELLAFLGEHADLPANIAAVPEAASPASRLRAGPNPFQALVAISGPPEAEVEVVDATGRMVARIPLSSAGHGSWDGRDAQGREAAAGVYFLHAGDGNRISVIRSR
jgi:hypothetical protein